MALEWIYSCDRVDWEELHQLYLAVHMVQETASDLKAGFSKSRFKCFAYDGSRLIAVGRALAGSGDCSYICGVAVHPEYQGHGIGRAVITRLIHLSRGHRRIYLHAARGKEPFYRKLGFRPTGTTMAMFRDEIQRPEGRL
jgi:GNAT superfamily N-acetyltransferase